VATIATISLSVHTVKIVAKILRRRIERKIEDVLGENQFGFRRGNGTRIAIETYSINFIFVPHTCIK
jgi:hypothetical protein